MHKPLVGIVMGSASDIEIGRKIYEELKFFNVPCEITVASAHRTPEDAANYASKAHSRGLKVIIAVAGLSAALPGVIAAHTNLPVIGVPVAAGTLGGIDALLAIAQMPPGIPCTSVGINGAKNAALMAIRILALENENLRKALSEYRKKNEEKVRDSRNKLIDVPTAPPEAFF